MDKGFINITMPNYFCGSILIFDRRVYEYFIGYFLFW